MRTDYPVFKPDGIYANGGRHFAYPRTKVAHTISACSVVRATAGGSVPCLAGGTWSAVRASVKGCRPGEPTLRFDPIGWTLLFASVTP